MKTKKERIFYLDLLRTFAILVVILYHIDVFFNPVAPQPILISYMAFHDIGRSSIPIFLMISGVLLLNKPYPSIPDFLKRRFARIVYPFIFWITLILVPLYLQGCDAGSIWIFFIGEPSITWYFWTLIGIYLFMPVINPFIKEYGLKGVEYFLAIWFITVILFTFNAYPLWTNFNLDMFAGYIGYPLLGYWMVNKKFSLSDKKLCIIGFIILIISLGTYMFLQTHNPDLIRYLNINIPVVFMGVGAFLFIMSMDRLNKFSSIRDNAIGKAITSLSICSYGMYFSHTIVVNWLLPYNTQSNLLFPLIFAITVFLSWLLPYVLSKIPYIKKFSGV